MAVSTLRWSSWRMARESRNSPRNVLARNVRRLRLERGLSQEALAAEATTRQALISNLEAGVANPTLELLIRLAQALHVDIRDLFEPSRG
ncbi:helix-turn-helix transcriptional regulator [Bradyrhizobium sp. USDA 3650]